MPPRSVLFKSILLSILAGTLLPTGSQAAERQEKATTLAELAARYDSTACRECHSDIYSQWERSHHARPLMGLNDDVFMAKYLRSGPLKVKPGEKAARENFPCLKCHLPQIGEASDGAIEELGQAILENDKDRLRNLNIGCLVCHQSKAVVHGRPEQGFIYGGKDAPDHPGVAMKKSPILKNSILCGQCHGLGPVLESETPVQCATLYGSYLHAYIPSSGSETCQSCHMPGGSHYMPPNFGNRNETSALLREALPMEVQCLTYTFQPKEEMKFPKAVVKIKIANKAGHRIPDG